MSFLERISFLETEGQEQARLAQCPEGSTNHHLSTLQVTIAEWPQDLLVELPWRRSGATEQHRVVVVAIEYRPDLHPECKEEPLPRKRNSGAWTCAVVASDHPSYPVGGHRIVVAAAEVARGRKIDLAGTLACS
jgi:hypothetical protein